MGPPPHEPPTCRCDECDLVMDFDDMPDSYFAFLSNQRKLAEPEKINGAIRDLGRTPEPEGAKNKVRSRASQPNLSTGSKPSVPSLPSIQRSSAQPAHAALQPGLHASAGRRIPSSPPPMARPQLSSKPPTAPNPSGSRPAGMFPSGNMAGNSGPMGSPMSGPMSGPMGSPMSGPMGSPMSGPPSGPMSAPMSASMSGSMPSPMSGGYAGQSSGHGYSYAPPLQTSPISVPPSRSNTLVYVLIAILLAAIGVLAYLVLTK